jgi:sRNA-binding carbon storage regulator CsrA
MLVLSRNPGESVELFGPDGRLLATITYITPSSMRAIRVGFEAEPDITIVRSEISGRPNNGKKPAYTRMDKGS